MVWIDDGACSGGGGVVVGTVMDARTIFNDVYVPEHVVDGRAGAVAAAPETVQPFDTLRIDENGRIVGYGEREVKEERACHIITIYDKGEVVGLLPSPSCGELPEQVSMIEQPEPVREVAFSDWAGRGFALFWIVAALAVVVIWIRLRRRSPEECLDRDVEALSGMIRELAEIRGMIDGVLGVPPERLDWRAEYYGTRGRYSTLEQRKEVNRAKGSV